MEIDGSFFILLDDGLTTQEKLERLEKLEYSSTLVTQVL